MLHPFKQLQAERNFSFFTCRK